ncbi:MAG: metallophosphoesterase family protein [Candidatus Woesearchaeota archaeon]
MRILAAADIHGDTELVKRLAEKALVENVDLVVLAGDLFHNDMNTKNIIGPFVEKNKRVVLLPGNHESVATADFVAKQYNAVNLHGYSVKDDDIGLFGCSAVNFGHNLSEEDIEDMLQKSHEYIKDAKKRIMVTHVHPTNSIMEGFTSFVHGSPAVEKMIRKLKPDIFICGHVHEASGIEEKIGDTRVINVSRVGKILDL